MKEQQNEIDTRTINTENDEIIRFDKKFWLLIIGVVILILTLIFFKYGKLFRWEKESKPVTGDPKRKVSECNLELPPDSAVMPVEIPLDIHQYFKERNDMQIIVELSKIDVPQLFSSPLDPAKTTLAELLSDENIEFFSRIIQFIFSNLICGKKNDYFSYNEFLRIHYHRLLGCKLYVKTTSGKYILIRRYPLIKVKPGSAKNTPEQGEISFLQDKKYFAEIYFAKLSTVRKTTEVKTLWTVSEVPKSYLTKITPEGIKNLLFAIRHLNNQDKSHRFINFSEIMVFQGDSGTTEVIKLMTCGQVVPIEGYCEYYRISFSSMLAPSYYGKSDEKNIDIYQLGYYLYYSLSKNQLKNQIYLSFEFLNKVKTFFEKGELEFPEGTPEDLKDFVKSCLKNNSGKTKGTSELLKHKFIAGSETQ